MMNRKDDRIMNKKLQGKSLVNFFSIKNRIEKKFTNFWPQLKSKFNH